VLFGLGSLNLENARSIFKVRPAPLACALKPRPIWLRLLVSAQICWEPLTFSAGAVSL